jgi:TRAP transporter 4TM/12TM fusion protein
MSAPVEHDASGARMQENEATESSELQLRRWRDLAGVATLIALAWTLAQIAFVLWPQIDTLTQRALHTGFGVALAFALFGRKARSPAARVLLAALGLAAFAPTLYVVINAQFITSGRIQGLDPVAPLDYAMGLLLLVLLFEAGRRVLGWGLAVFVALFVAYFFAGPYLPGVLAHRYSGLSNFIDTQFLSLHGIFGTPVGVSASTVFYFILFAAVYDIYGGGRMIIELAFALTGRAVGGPAKAAVVSSGLLGSVSGSAVANVMSTGIFTIPLMKKVGYSPRFAGAVEAAASTGGQLVPPVMGAAAFIMADYLRTSYQTIVLAAILPAVVYYVALLVMVDLKARAEGLRQGEELQARPLAQVLAARGHLLLPLAWLVYRIVAGYPVEKAALEACLVTLVAGSLRAGTRRGLRPLVEALIVSAERTVSVALPCALAGVVVAVIAFTGLGTKFTGLMVWAAGGSLAALLVLTMLASLVLGTGMPTTSAYIMAAVLLAPALISVGAEPLTAHFFIFYFAILSMVTPPVALASYAAASIARASPSDTGWTALALCLPGFLIPFAAVVHPGLLMIGTPLDAAWGVLNSMLGFVGIGVALIGWLFRPMSMPWRAFFAVVGLMSLLPDALSTLACITLLAGAVAWLWRAARRQRSAVLQGGE